MQIEEIASTRYLIYLETRMEDRNDRFFLTSTPSYLSNVECSICHSKPLHFKSLDENTFLELKCYSNTEFKFSIGKSVCLEWWASKTTINENRTIGGPFSYTEWFQSKFITDNLFLLLWKLWIWSAASVVLFYRSRKVKCFSNIKSIFQNIYWFHLQVYLRQCDHFCNENNFWSQISKFPFEKCTNLVFSMSICVYAHSCIFFNSYPIFMKYGTQFES